MIVFVVVVHFVLLCLKLTVDGQSAVPTVAPTLSPTQAVEASLQVGAAWPKAQRNQFSSGQSPYFGVRTNATFFEQTPDVRSLADVRPCWASIKPTSAPQRAE